MTDIVRRAMQSEVGRSTLQRFLPKRVISGAYGSGGGGTDLLSLLTEPRSVEATVLVSDLRGFTGMSEKLAPVEALGLLNEVQGTLADTVREHGGTVDKFLGDGMLAVFGAPEPLDDHAAHAVAAVIAMGARRDLEREPHGPRRGDRSAWGSASTPGSWSRLPRQRRPAGVHRHRRHREHRLAARGHDQGPRRRGAAQRRDHPSHGGAGGEDGLGAGHRVESLGEVAIRGRKEKMVLHTLRDQVEGQAAGAVRQVPVGAAGPAA